jgi:hypothetical protein
MSLLELIKNGISSDYYDPKFRAQLEAYLPTLRNKLGTSTQYVDVGDAFLYRNDLIGYLNKLRIHPDLHWIVMRLNFWTSTSQFNKTTTKIMLADRDDIERVRTMWRTSGDINA